MVATVARPRRVATQERWVKALQRAFDNGLSAYEVANTGAVVVTSKSDPGTAYQTDGVECGCQAWLNGDPICQHRALYHHLRGVLDLDPEPTPPAAPVAVALPSPYQCQTCEDSGAVRVPNRIRPDLTYRKPCPDCRESVPTLTFRKDITEGDQPSTVPVPNGNCPVCAGTGCHRAPGQFADCEACEGSGYVHPTLPTFSIVTAIEAGLSFDLPLTMPTTRACRECEGTGTGLDAHGKFTDCPDCRGVGIVPRAIPALDWTATLAAD